MQTNPSACSHKRSLFCKEGGEQREQHDAAADSACVLQRWCTAYEEELERVEVFKYLSHLLSYEDGDV